MVWRNPATNTVANGIYKGELDSLQKVSREMVLETRQYVSGLEDQVTRHELMYKNNMYVVERQFTRNGFE